MKNTELNTPAYNSLVRDFETEISKERKLKSEVKSKQDKESNEDLYVEQHVSSVKEFLAYMEKEDFTEIEDIDQELVDEYIYYLQTQRINTRRGGLIATGTINKQKGAIIAFWKFLELQEYKIHPIRLTLSKRDQPVPKVLSKEEIKQLYEVTDNSAIGYRDRCMLALYYGCGLRRSEGHELILQDIDFGRNRIHIRCPKNKHDRYVMLPPKVQKWIEEYVYEAREMYLPEGVHYNELFIGERGRPIHYESLRARMTALWNRIKEKYGTDKPSYGLHILRHSLGTHLYMSGMDVNKIALMLGHRSLEATQLYIHSANELKA